MTTNIDDIFEKGGNTDLGEFFRFQNVGDRIAGTFVDLLEGIDGYQNEQYIVVLQREGVNHRVSIRKTHSVLVDRMRPVRLGQIIGFSFDEERPSKMGANTKIINLKQDPSMVDEEWIKARVEGEAKFGVDAVDALIPKAWSTTDAPVAPEQATEAPAESVAPAADVPFSSPADDSLVETVKTLVSNKGLIGADASKDEVMAKVKEITGLELTAENGPSIINTIATYTGA